MTKPLFSVIIPVRQSNPYLRETLTNLKKQSLKNFEVLVITDKISATANPSEKRNLGGLRAKGDYLVFFDDDSFPKSNYFKNARKLVNRHHEYAGFCGPCLTPPKDNIYQQASGLFWSSWLGSGGAGVYRNSIKPARFVNDYPSVNLIIKKDYFIQAGMFDSRYWPGEDTYLCLKLTSQLKVKILYHPSLIVYHHRRPAIIHHLQQIARYAIQRGYFIRKLQQTSLKIGYLAPSFFLIYIILEIFNLIYIKQNILNYPLYLYLSILIFTFFSFLFKKNNLFSSILATVTIPITHLYYGILFLHGLFKKETEFKPHRFDPKTGKYIGG